LPRGASQLSLKAILKGWIWMGKVHDITVREASEILGVSKNTIRRMIKRSQLSKVYVQGKYGRTITLSSERSEGLIYKAVTYEELKRELEELKARYEQALFQLGHAQAEKQRRLELEEKTESLREEKLELQRDYEELKREREQETLSFPEDREKMKISEEGIEEYRKLVKRKYSIDLSRAQASQQFADLLALFRVIYRPIEGIDKENFLECNWNDEGK